MDQRIKTRFTERFGVAHPIMLAPMARVSGGRLAAAVAHAGGLGMIGGGYADPAWLEGAFQDAGNAPVGVGFITWSLAETLARRPDLLDRALDRAPRALMVSFGDAEPFVARAREAGVPVIWQVQTLAQARQALAAGVDAIVAQGQEAGGHGGGPGSRFGGGRSLASLVPALRDLAGKETILLAAGGVSDGRGLAAALMLGGDGVAMGTRFFASEEASASAAAKAALAAAGGDQTVRTIVFDTARGLDWPEAYTGRALANDFLRRWPDDPAALRAAAGRVQADYEASAEDDFSTRVLFAGEGLDMIRSVEPAGAIIERTVEEAARLLRAAPSCIVAPGNDKA